MINQLLDEKSFVELDSFYGNTVKIGYGTIDERPVYIYEENGSGCEYPAETMEDVIHYVSEYLRVLYD